MVESGGSSYIIIYLIVLLLVALPVILLEMQYGLFYRRNAVSCFEKAGRTPGRFFGWQQMLGTGLLCVYYLALIAWVLSTLVTAFVPSFFEQLGTKDSGFFESKILNKLGTKDSGFFELKILNNDPSLVVNSAESSAVNKIDFSFGFSWLIFASCFILILLAGFVVYTGIKGLEKVNMILVPGLFLLMFGLLAYSLTLKNSFEGVKYLFQFEGHQFARPNIWYGALKQAIFSTGIMFGTFIVFSKSSDIKIDKANDALIVISADTLIGVMSGIIVVSIVSHNYGTNPDVLNNSITINDKLKDFFDKGESAGSTLVFVHLPVIFLKMNETVSFTLGSFGLGNFLFIFFLLALFFAAFTSLISLLEVFIDAITENFKSMTRGNSIFTWSLFCLLMTVFYSLSIGGSLIDEQDSAILLTATIAGLVQVLIFTNHKNFSKVIRTNEKHSYLKLSPGNWFVKVCRYIVTPILFIMSIYGFMQFFSLDYYFTQLFSTDGFWGFLRSGKSLTLTLPKIMSWVMMAWFFFFVTFLTFNRNENLSFSKK